jgi:hypothetical protein
MGKAKGETYAELQAHLRKWRKGRGFNANPFGEQEEQIRWLCERIDASRKTSGEKARSS